MLGDVVWCDTPFDAAEEADAVVILTEWNAYRGMDLKALAQSMRAPVMIDLRNIYTLEEAQASPFDYHSLGRRSVLSA